MAPHNNSENPTSGQNDQTVYFIGSAEIQARRTFEKEKLLEEWAYYQARKVLERVIERLFKERRVRGRPTKGHIDTARLAYDQGYWRAAVKKSPSWQPQKVLHFNIFVTLVSCTSQSVGIWIK